MVLCEIVFYALYKTILKNIYPVIQNDGKSLVKRFGSCLHTVSRFTFSSSVCLVSGRQQFGLSGIRMCRFEIRVVYAFPFPSVLIEAFLPVWHANNGK